MCETLILVGIVEGRGVWGGLAGQISVTLGRGRGGLAALAPRGPFWGPLRPLGIILGGGGMLAKPFKSAAQGLVRCAEFFAKYFLAYFKFYPRNQFLNSPNSNSNPKTRLRRGLA